MLRSNFLWFLIVRTSFKCNYDSIVPPCGSTVCILKYGWPLGALNPKPWQHQCLTLPIKLSTLKFPLWELLCLFHDWLPPFVLSSKEQPWRMCQVVDLRLWLPVFDLHFHVSPPHRKPILPAAKDLNISHTNTQFRFFFISRSDYTIPISYRWKPWGGAQFEVHGSQIKNGTLYIH